MKEWSDDELDELFRKSAEEFEPAYQSSDWQDLRRRLDEADGVTGGGGLKSMIPWLAGALLLLLGGIGVYYYNNRDKDNKTGGHNEKIAVSVSKEKDGKPATRPEGPSATTVNKNETDVGTGIGVSDKNGQPSEHKIVSSKNKPQDFAAVPEAAQKIKGLPSNPASVSGVRKPTNLDGKRGEGVILLSEKMVTPKIAANSGENESRSTPLVGKSTFSKASLKPGQNKNISLDASDGTTQGKSLPSSLRDEWPDLSELSFRETFREGDGLTYPAISYKMPKKADAPLPRQAVANTPLWSVRIGIAPDLSMVRVSEMMKSMHPGPSASLLVAYNMSDHWALQTGVIRSLKTYNAQFDDYYGSEEWGNEPMPANIDGNVRVFEIPLNLRYDIGYDLSPRQKCLWFLSLGVSSYKMERETYTYNYDSFSSGQKRPPKEMDKGTGWYFLSHANVSVGYEHRLTNRLSIIAEPYLRVPLRGVGFGKVNLFTTGVWFSARYTPVFRK